MKITKEICHGYDFEFWSGGKDTADDLTEREIQQVLECLEDIYPDGMSETQLNDIFWFERDWIAECPGYADYDELLEDEEREEERW